MILIHSAATTNPEQEAQSSYMALIPGAKSHWDAIQKGILGLEDKKTAQKTCTMEKSWSRYYFSIKECQEVSCGSCVSSWELEILPLLSSFSGGLLNEVLLLMASQSRSSPQCKPVWVTDPQGAASPPLPLSPCMAPPWGTQMPEWSLSQQPPLALTGLHTPSNQDCATVPSCFIFPAS